MAEENGNTIDYRSVLADMEAKRAALDSAIANLKIFLSGRASVGEPPPPRQPISAEPIELHKGALLDKSLPAAIKLYLSAVKRKMTNKEIANALREHGVESTSENFEGVVSGAIKRLGDSGELLRFKDGWALAALYPEHLRNRISQEKKPARKKPKAKRATKSNKKKKSQEPMIVASPEGVGLESRIEGILKSAPAKTFASEEIAKALNALPQAVSLALGRMALKGKADKLPGKLYQANSGKLKEMKVG